MKKKGSIYHPQLSVCNFEGQTLISVTNIIILNQKVHTANSLKDPIKVQCSNAKKKNK